MEKSVKIKQKTLILLNKTKIKILLAKPDIKKVTDDYTIREALQKYNQEVKNGKPKRTRDKNI